MKPFLQLNLLSEKDKAEAANNPPDREKEPAQPVVTDQNLNRMVKIETRHRIVEKEILVLAPIVIVPDLRQHARELGLLPAPREIEA